MGPLSRFQLLQHSKKKIISTLNNYNKNVLTILDLSQILKNNKNSWGIAKVTTNHDFISFLKENKILDEIEIQLPTRLTSRYTFKNATKYEIALSIRKNSYLSHYSALFIFGLTDNVVKNVYTNLEQSRKPQSSKNNLLQENIDKAFNRPMRTTNNIALLPKYNVYLLNGKNLRDLEVIDYSFNNVVLPVTSIERTLIDIAIRPNYSGGVNEVLKAFKMAKGKISVNRLVATLTKMKYIYPYHQIIGFYLEKTGYDKSLLKLIEKIEIKYKFYLTYQIKNKEFSKKWNLYYPKDL